MANNEFKEVEETFLQKYDNQRTIKIDSNKLCPYSYELQIKSFGCNIKVNPILNNSINKNKNN